MGQNVNLKEEFERYFNELEGFTLRAERFYFDVEDPDFVTRSKLMRKWLEAAFLAGCEAMSKDTISTLRDYGTAVAGIEEPTYNATECFDRSADNLNHYYEMIFHDYYKGKQNDS